MIKVASLSIAAALLVCGLAPAPAQAGPNRTFVSGMGTDSGACTRAAPCKTFAFAITQTNAGGEIDVLDPAGYGAVTITKAISIVNDGVGVAAIGVSSGNAITINAGASDSVHLRGLTLAGLNSGSIGIAFNTGGNLAIENCVIRNFPTGILIAPTTSSSFSVSNTIASNNNDTGILVFAGGSAVVTGVFSKVAANNNGFDGIGAFPSGTTGASLNVTIANSEASNNGDSGVAAGSEFGNGPTAVVLLSVVANNNKTGIEADGNGTVLRFTQSVVTGNNTGVSTSSGGAILSYGDNDINGNTNDNTGVLTVIPTH